MVLNNAYSPAPWNRVSMIPDRANVHARAAALATIAPNRAVNCRPHPDFSRPAVRIRFTGVVWSVSAET
jgi:hypothetical protein